MYFFTVLKYFSVKWWERNRSILLEWVSSEFTSRPPTTSAVRPQARYLTPHWDGWEGKSHVHLHVCSLITDFWEQREGSLQLLSYDWNLMFCSADSPLCWKQIGLHLALTERHYFYIDAHLLKKCIIAFYILPICHVLNEDITQNSYNYFICCFLVHFTLNLQSIILIASPACPTQWLPLQVRKWYVLNELWTNQREVC